ncbi:MAG: hypothetical protein RLZZ403_673 [Pseudomonadota bacterium]|jgi:hypothetical protein
MSITLSDGTTAVTLNPDLFWADEHDWHPVEQKEERTITGALVISSALRVGGRPITLQPEDDTSGATSLATLTQLRNWAAVPGQQLTLTLRGVTRTVIFRHQDGGLNATPWIHYSDVQSGDWYFATIRLMEI